MRLLFDQNLSRRLISLLAKVFPDSTHVALVGLDTATDRDLRPLLWTQGRQLNTQ